MWTYTGVLKASVPKYAYAHTYIHAYMHTYIACTYLLMASISKNSARSSTSSVSQNATGSLARRLNLRRTCEYFHVYICMCI